MCFKMLNKAIWVPNLPETLLKSSAGLLSTTTGLGHSVMTFRARLSWVSLLEPWRLLRNGAVEVVFGRSGKPGVLCVTVD